MIGSCRRCPRSASTSARELCQKVLSYASPQEHHAEEIDPRTGRHLVNLSQTFTHLALINAVMHVVVTERAAQTASRAAANRLVF